MVLLIKSFENKNYVWSTLFNTFQHGWKLFMTSVLSVSTLAPLNIFRFPHNLYILLTFAMACFILKMKHVPFIVGLHGHLKKNGYIMVYGRKMSLETTGTLQILQRVEVFFINRDTSWWQWWRMWNFRRVKKVISEQRFSSKIEKLRFSSQMYSIFKSITGRRCQAGSQSSEINSSDSNDNMRDFKFQIKNQANQNFIMQNMLFRRKNNF